VVSGGEGARAHAIATRALVTSALIHGSWTTDESPPSSFSASRSFWRYAASLL
jgi:hypothetical protein